MRSSAQITRSPREWAEHREQECRRARAALSRELARARDDDEPWYLWIVARRQGVHQHDLRDESGRAIACPVAGCNAVRDVPDPHLVATRRASRAGKSRAAGAVA